MEPDSQDSDITFCSEHESGSRSNELLKRKSTITKKKYSCKSCCSQKVHGCQKFPNRKVFKSRNYKICETQNLNLEVTSQNQNNDVMIETNCNLENGNVKKIESSNLQQSEICNFRESECEYYNLRSQKVPKYRVFNKRKCKKPETQNLNLEVISQNQSNDVKIGSDCNLENGNVKKIESSNSQQSEICNFSENEWEYYNLRSQNLFKYDLFNSRKSKKCETHNLNLEVISQNQNDDGKIETDCKLENGIIKKIDSSYFRTNENDGNSNLNLQTLRKLEIFKSQNYAECQSKDLIMETVTVTQNQPNSDVETKNDYDVENDDVPKVDNYESLDLQQSETCSLSENGSENENIVKNFMIDLLECLKCVKEEKLKSKQNLIRNYKLDNIVRLTSEMTEEDKLASKLAWSQTKVYIDEHFKSSK